MKQEHIDWVRQNEVLFKASRRYTPDELTKIFEIYNAITGENKAKTRCARCLTRIVQTIYQKYQQL